jgi:hypothetical protein
MELPDAFAFIIVYLQASCIPVKIVTGGEKHLRKAGLSAAAGKH